MAAPSSPPSCDIDRQGTREAHSQVLRPFEVLACISPIAYRLALPPKCHIRDVFHVVFLKKFKGAPPAAVPRLPPIKHGRVLPQPEKVLHAHLNRGV
jgi:hypothetical protein